MRARRPIPPGPTRRGVLGVGGALDAGGLLTACGGPADDARSSRVGKGWSSKSRPTWAELPAVKAGQVVSRSNEAQFSHAGYAPLVEQLAAAVAKSKKAAA